MAAAPVGAVRCPSCRELMIALAFEAHYGATVQLDACDRCHAFWVDDRESLRLTPGSTVRLFEHIHDRRERPRGPLAERLACARRDLLAARNRGPSARRCFPLLAVSDRPRPLHHVFDFLREKSFVRPLTPVQLAELKAQVRSVNCSHCGAPVDLAAATTCGYCRTPLSMLDFGQIERVLASLRDAEQRAEKLAQRAVIEATLSLALARERRQGEHGPPPPTWSKQASAPS